jgi:hypothetical protein
MIDFSTFAAVLHRSWRELESGDSGESWPVREVITHSRFRLSVRSRQAVLGRSRSCGPAGIPHPVDLVIDGLLPARARPKRLV